MTGKSEVGGRCKSKHKKFLWCQDFNLALLVLFQWIKKKMISAIYLFHMHS